MRSLGVDDIVELLRRALDDRERGLGERELRIDDEALSAHRARRPTATRAAR